MQLEPWFKSWVLHSVFSAGNGRNSVEAWFSTALDIEECLAGGVEGDVHLFVADVVKSFDTVDRGVCWIGFWVVLVYLLGSVVRTLSIMPRLGYGSSLLLALESLEPGMVAFLRGVPLSMMFIVALYLPCCRYLQELPEVTLQLYADNLKCVSSNPGQLLRAALRPSVFF